VQLAGHDFLKKLGVVLIPASAFKDANAIKAETIKRQQKNSQSSSLPSKGRKVLGKHGVMQRDERCPIRLQTRASPLSATMAEANA
jgi:hypothetical protein